MYTIMSYVERNSILVDHIIYSITLQQVIQVRLKQFFLSIKNFLLRICLLIKNDLQNYQHFNASGVSSVTAAAYITIVLDVNLLPSPTTRKRMCRSWDNLGLKSFLALSEQTSKKYTLQ